MLSRLARILLWSVASIAVVVALAVGFCAFSYRHDMRVDSTNGINEAGYVKIGGTDQWIQIRGRDRGNPILLWLTGGPGLSQIPRTYFYRAWEKDFTLVLWDQRGEGKTFERSGKSVAETMTIAQMTKDGIEVAEYLRKHLHKNKIILLGHSWGSMVGVHMVHARPDLFSAYVGTGQVVNLETDVATAYPLLVERAQATGNENALQQLTSVGPPPYLDPSRAMRVAILANELDPAPPHTSLPSPGELWAGVKVGLFPPPYLAAGGRFSIGQLWEPMLKDDLPALGLRFEVPVVFIQGSEDLVTVTALAKHYFDEIEAPSKQFVALPGDGHLAIIFDRDQFLRVLKTRVRPFAVSEDSAP